MKLPNECRLEQYKKMYRIRRFEETLLELFSDNVLQGTTHTSIGQEADAVAVMEHAADLSYESVYYQSGNGRARTNAYRDGGVADIGMDIFERGLCLPSDITMPEGAQDVIIEIIKSCFE